jgi:hypothetical protein
MIALPAINPVLLLGIFLILLVIGPLFFSVYCGLSPSPAFCAMLASAAGGTICFLTRAIAAPGVHEMPSDALDIGPYTVHLARPLILPSAAAGACIVFLTAFGLRLWVRWVENRMKPEERLPGRFGVKAWFGAANVTVGLLIVTLAWCGFDFSPLASAAVIAAMLAVYPLLRTEPPAAAVVNDLSPEREKIVAMLETGKLTPEESAELLRALSETSPKSSTNRAPTSANQRLILVGAAFVGLGFFLPWFVVNPGREVGRMLNQFQLNGNNPSNGMSVTPNHGPALGTLFEAGNVSISGGDIQHGLGWLALALALTAAVLPYVATTLDAATARTVRLLCLGAGGIIVLHLLTSSFRFVSIGLIVAIAGYALEVTGSLRERRTTSP